MVSNESESATTPTRNFIHSSASASHSARAHFHFYDNHPIAHEQRSRWENLLNSCFPHAPLWNPDATSIVNGSCAHCGKAMSTQQKKSRGLLRCCVGALLLIGFILLLGGLMGTGVTSSAYRITRVWGKPGKIGEGLSSWPTDFSRGINPIPCHSHNDYWRLVPLYSAISAGCVSVEADIWLFDQELYVGHSTASLTPNRTLKNLYLNPLLDILAHQNPITRFHPGGDGSPQGVFDTNPSQSLVLLIDFKTSGEELWPYLLSTLQPLRERGYLTYLNGSQLVYGPITIVGTGNAPFDLIASQDSNPHLDVFFDAPLDQLRVEKNGVIARGPAEADPITLKLSRKVVLRDSQLSHNTNSYTTMNSYYASVSFKKVFRGLSDDKFSDQQMELLREQIREAHSRGLKARYWELPFWPISLRNHVWDILVKEGVDLLNVDDLKGAAEKDWSRTKKPWWSTR